MTCALRACCQRPAGAFVSTASEPRSLLIDGTEAPIFAELPDPPRGTEDVAWHECGHAVVAHAFGAAFKDMHLDGQARVVGMDTMSGVAAIAMLLAGPAAQRAYVRQYSTLFDVELDDFFARVDQVQFGNCDECRAALIATVSAYLDDGDRRAIFRAGEKLGNELVSRPDIRRAIGNLATALVEARSLTGAEARLIIDEYVKFGGHARA